MLNARQATPRRPPARGSMLTVGGGCSALPPGRLISNAACQIEGRSTPWGGHPVDIRSRVDIRADDVPDGINAADHPAGLSFSRMRPRLRSRLLHVGDLVREDRIEHVRSFERDVVAAVFDNHVLIPPSRNTWL
jgi:hypothetical protein